MDLNRHFIIGNLTDDAKELTKESDGTKYLLINIAVNEGKDQPATYFTAFLYGFSEERKQRLTKGSKVYVYGSYRDEISKKPNSDELFINRLFKDVKDFNIIYSRKDE